MPKTKVNKFTRAGNYGKIITCPECNSSERIYHFSWSSLTCQHCQLDIVKYDWLVS